MYQNIFSIGEKGEFCKGQYLRNHTLCKLGFIVQFVSCDQLPISVSLRGGFCRRGNLPVQSNN